MNSITITLKNQLWLSERHRNVFSSLEPLLIGSSWIQLIKQIQHQIGKTRMFVLLHVVDLFQKFQLKMDKYIETQLKGYKTWYIMNLFGCIQFGTFDLY